MSTIMRNFFRIVSYKNGGSYNKKVFGDVFIPEKFFLGDDLEVLRVFMGVPWGILGGNSGEIFGWGVKDTLKTRRSPTALLKDPRKRGWGSPRER